MAWTNGSGDPKRVTAADCACDDDFAEIAEAINRRRRILFFGEHDYWGLFEPDEYISRRHIASHSPPPYRALRPEFDYIINNFASLGGAPPTPVDMHWLWPEADGDEDKKIVTAAPDPGEVNFFTRMNGTSSWTDPSLDKNTYIRTVHMNEMRWGIEHLTRGYLRVPIYLTVGLLSLLPDVPWTGGAIVNNGTDELRTIGYPIMRTGETPPRGIVNATVRSGSYLSITVDVDCTVEAYHCLRSVEFSGDQPTWNEYDPSESLAWATPGGTGSGDANYLGSLALTANTPASLSTSALVTALQSMVDGDEQAFLFRRNDTGTENVGISVDLVVEFDLNTPPN